MNDSPLRARPRQGICDRRCRQSGGLRKTGAHCEIAASRAARRVCTGTTAAVKNTQKKRRETRKKTLKNHAPEVHSSNRMIFRALAVFCFFGSRPPFS